MPLSEGYKKIVEAWANTGDTTDPDAASLTPPLDIQEGWDETFSGSTGLTPRRQVFNEQFHRRDQTLIDIRNHGVLPYDSDIPTPAGSVRAAVKSVWQATEDTTVGPEEPLQTSWRNIRPPLPTGTPSQVTGLVLSSHDENEVTADWNMISDDDRRSGISAYMLEWKYEGVSGWPLQEEIHDTTYTWKVADRTKDVHVRVRGVNANGNGPVSDTVILPKGSILLGRLPTMPPPNITVNPAANQHVEVSWGLPPEYFTHFDILWSQVGGTQNIISDFKRTFNSILLNNSTADFTVQIRSAVENVGDGPWSDPITIRADRLRRRAVPETPTVTSETYAPFIVDFEWPFSSDTSHAGISEYEWEWKYDEDTWSGVRTATKKTFATLTLPDNSKSVNFRVRAKNVDGDSDWSLVHTVHKENILDYPVNPTFSPTKYVLDGRPSRTLFGWPRVNSDTAFAYAENVGNIAPFTLDRTIGTYTRPSNELLLLADGNNTYGNVMYQLFGNNTAANMTLRRIGLEGTGFNSYNVPDLYGSGYSGSNPFTPVSMISVGRDLILAATQSRRNPSTNAQETRTRLWIWDTDHMSGTFPHPNANNRLVRDTLYTWTSYRQPVASPMISYGVQNRFYVNENGTLRSYQLDASKNLSRVSADDIPLTVLPDVDTLAEAHVYNAFCWDNAYPDDNNGRINTTGTRNHIMVWANTPGNPLYRCIDTNTKQLVPEYDIQMPTNLNIKGCSTAGQDDRWLFAVTDDPNNVATGNKLLRYRQNTVSYVTFNVGEALGRSRFGILATQGRDNASIITRFTYVGNERRTIFNIPTGYRLTLWPRYYREA